MTAPIITEREVLGMFYERLQQSPGVGYVDPICTPIIRSDQDSETYPWIGQVPQLSAKGGSKKFDQLGTTEWALKNVEYQGGIAFPKKHVLYEKTDQIMIRVSELAQRTQAHWAVLVGALLIAAEATACYDGQYFFDTDHNEGDSGAQSNDIGFSLATAPTSVSGTPTQPSAGEMVFAIMAGVEQILSLKDDKGEYCNEEKTEFLVLTGIPLLTNALGALRNRSLEAGDANLLIEQDSYRLRLQSTPRLNAWTSKFAVFATQGDQKPILRQQRVPNQSEGTYDLDGLSIETLWLGSEHCKLNDECLMSVETERAAGYGDWKKAVLVTLST